MRNVAFSGAIMNISTIESCRLESVYRSVSLSLGSTKEVAMSEQENVQTVQAIYAAFGRGDIPGVLDALTDDIEWWIDGPPEIPYAGTQHGREAVAQNFVRLNDTVSFESFAPEEFIAQGNQVVAIGADQRRVRKTGKLVENKWAM